MGLQEQEKAKNYRCIGLLAHVDAGKTTLSEAVLYTSGTIRKLGRVDNRDAYLDTYALERERGITIFSKQAVCQLGDTTVTLLDTPGHVDFSAEMERTLQVLDYAVLVIGGADGVQGHTETLWSLLKRYQVPTFLFINKMDQPGTDREALMAELKKRLNDSCVDFAALDGPEDAVPEEIWETIAMSDEEFLEQYLGDRKSGPVFLSVRAPYQGVKKNALENIIRDIAKRAGIDKRVFPHLLRHTFATHALNKGMPLAGLCDLMGHASVETTRIYAKNSRQKLKYDYDLYVSA